jgi:hypothetical protein
MANRKFNVVFWKEYSNDYSDVKGRKGIFRRVGNAIEKDDGSISVFMDAVPINFNGHLKLYEMEDRSEGAEPVQADFS